jgi:hypothetical protein
MRVITALVVQMMGYCLDKINRAISLHDKFGIAHTFTGISIDISEQKGLMQN